MPVNRYAWKVWYRDYRVWTRYWWSSLVGALGEPVLYFLAFGYGVGAFIQSVDGLPYIQFLAPALVMSAIMHAASFETTYSSYTRMEVQKTFHSIAMTPIGVDEIVAGEILWGATKALLPGFVMFAACWLMNLVPSPWALALVPVLMLEALLFSALGMLVTSFARNYDFFTYYFTLFLVPMSLMAGTFFPLSQIPEPMRTAAWVLPLTGPVDLARHLFLGEVPAHAPITLAWLLFSTTVIFIWACRRMVRRLVV